MEKAAEDLDVKTCFCEALRGDVVLCTNQKKIMTQILHTVPTKTRRIGHCPTVESTVA